MNKIKFVPASAGYTYQPGNPNIETKLDGGISLTRQDILNPSSIVSCQWVLENDVEYEEFNIFFKGPAKEGAAWFLMDLTIDEAYPVERTCKFVSGSVVLDTVDGPVRTISGQVEVEPIYYDPAYWDMLQTLIDGYGSLAAALLVLNQFEQLVNVDLPASLNFDLALAAQPEFTVVRASEKYLKDQDDILALYPDNRPAFEWDEAVAHGVSDEGARQNVAENSNTALGATRFSSGGNRGFAYSSGLPFPFDICGYVSKAETGLSYLYHQNIAPVIGKTYSFRVDVRYEDGRSVASEFGAPDTENSPLNPFTFIILGGTRTWNTTNKVFNADGSVTLWNTITPNSSDIRGWGILIRDTHKAVSSPLLVTAFQIEPDATFPSSYMPTGATSFVRATDSLKISLSNVTGWQDGAPFVITVSGWTAEGIGSSKQRFITIDDETSSNLISVYRGTDNYIYMSVVDGGISQAIIQGPIVSGKHDVSVGVNIEENNMIMSVSVDGGESVDYGPVTSATIPTVTTMVLGNRSAMDEALFGAIKDLQIDLSDVSWKWNFTTGSMKAKRV